MEGYKNQEYKPQLKRLQIVHGWLDEVIPLENIYKFASESKSSLNIVDSDHRLNNALDLIEQAFTGFLAVLREEQSGKCLN